MRSVSKKNAQHGALLIEALVAIVIFSIGILALLRMQSLSIGYVAQAGYRTQASYLASQIIGDMWVDKANLNNYALNQNNQRCAQGVNSSTYPAVSSWLHNDVPMIPVSGVQQQILIGANNLVTVTVCWQPPGDPVVHQFIANAQIN